MAKPYTARHQRRLCFIPVGLWQPGTLNFKGNCLFSGYGKALGKSEGDAIVGVAAGGRCAFGGEGPWSWEADMAVLKGVRVGVRIAVGYVAILALMVVVFVVGWFALGTLAGQLGVLTTVGATAIDASDSQVNLVRLRLDAQVFVAAGTDAAAAAVNADLDRLQQVLTHLGQLKGADEAVRDLLIVNDHLEKFRGELMPLISGRLKQQRAITDEFGVIGPGIRQKLAELIEAAASRQDLTTAVSLGRVLDLWMSARMAVSGFLRVPEEKRADEARQRLAEAVRGAKATFGMPAEAMERPEVKRVGIEVVSQVEGYADKFNEIAPITLQNQRIINESLPVSGSRLDQALEALQNRMLHRAAETEVGARQGISEAQRFSLVMGGAAIVLSLILAWLIGRSVLGTLSQALATLNDAARQVATGSNQASIAIGQVSEGARTQMNAVRQIGVAVKQSANAIEDIAGSSAQTYKFTKEAVLVVDGALINVAVLDRLVKTISENSRNIGRITSVITRIANQTNMLSLNAAIEAARAGEHGRGFAVVAEEVRKLAEEVANSAQEIAEIVAAASTEAERGVAVSRDVGADMSRIGDVFRQIERMASVIASATTEQQASTKEIDATVQSLAQISESNATASEEILATMNDLVKIADSARSGAETFKSMM